jgi:hypothetical protein
VYTRPALPARTSPPLDPISLVALFADRRDRVALVALFAGALLLEAGTALWGLSGTRIAFSQLGVFFDGHLYIEIAKSFPLPYSESGVRYAGQAPGYPALLYLGRLATFGGLDWGALALAGSWLPAALCAPLCFVLCRQVGAPPVFGALLFVLANPRWIGLSATAAPEPIAVLLAMLCLHAHLRGARLAAMLWLAAAVLARFQAILLGLPLAFDLLVLRRERDPASWLRLSIPPLVLALYHLYLRLRIPGFETVFDAHAVWWQTGFTWPLAEFLTRSWDLSWRPAMPLVPVAWATLLVYLAAIVVGLRARDGRLVVLPLWVAVIVLFHVSLVGPIGVSDFPRLSILAWPAAALILARALAPVRPRWVVGAVLALACAFGVQFSQRQIRWAVVAQRSVPWIDDAIRHIADDHPRWIIDKLVDSGAVQIQR